MIKTLEKMSWEKGYIIKTAKANIMSVMPTAYYHEKLLKIVSGLSTQCLEGDKP